MCDVRGRVVAITGASGNLGASIAKLFASHGVKLVLLDRSEAHVREVLGELAASPNARVFAVDVTDEDATRAALEKAKSELGGLDALVATVGGFKGGTPAADAPWADWESMLHLNLKSVVACARAALPTFLAQKSGAIVNVASVAALGASPGSAAYGASKSAVVHFTKTLADEVKASGVRVNAVLPGTMDTPQNRSWMSQADLDKAVELTAVAEAILFLASNAARGVTGVALPVTGKQ
jgi:NAD(P)-dependent dehydrogenase (short-subunit alcohol dehydrogenase family)